ncbi:hypothetical protein M2405_004180 [Rhodococcus erythropolis]|uniref:hypothetical protein n=1 Tax=Rhodococcus erythropolis TaxID=1833 RepID=UPI0021699D4A|nr:hypothetical protein [Rhodococcus erythropolis]MCS4255877.1 hypothetical protein [Rhodococcus erythropolis]MCW2425394.1 hypothetical protein [Rhodococcus erythropolis]
MIVRSFDEKVMFALLSVAAPPLRRSEIGRPWPREDAVKCVASANAAGLQVE